MFAYGNLFHYTGIIIRYSVGNLVIWISMMVFISDVKYYNIGNIIPLHHISLLNKETKNVPIRTKKRLDV